MFQFIARHLLHTLNVIVVEKFHNSPPLLSHVCPAALSFDGYYMTDEIPCNSGKSLLLQGILLLVHTEMRSENDKVQ